MTREERAIQILEQRQCCRECVVENCTCTECDEAFEMAFKTLKQEPRKGHWIWVIDETPSTPDSLYEVNYAGWVCSCCHEFPDDICEWDDPDEPPTYKFCPNCGSDNREVEE